MDCQNGTLTRKEQTTYITGHVDFALADGLQIEPDLLFGLVSAADTKGTAPCSSGKVSQHAEGDPAPFCGDRLGNLHKLPSLDCHISPFDHLWWASAVVTVATTCETVFSIRRPGAYGE
jgi:hypothetical protein